MAFVDNRQNLAIARSTDELEVEVVAYCIKAMAVIMAFSHPRRSYRRSQRHPS